MTVCNFLTIDVEDYFQVSAFEGAVPRGQWEQFEGRVETNTRRVLALLDRHDVRATFFVLGWTADRYPGLVREIDAAGHRIGSHSYWHRLVYQLTPAEFREDLCRSRDVLQDLTGRAVTAFRAPSFSITRNSLWAFEVLAEEGFQQDSSVFPTYHDRYGIPDADPRIHRVETPAGAIVEYPPGVFEWAGCRLPVSGGGYFRLYPSWWTHYCLRRINRRDKRPFVFYFHPWELDAQQPRLSGSALSRFRHYVNLAATERKLAALLQAFRFSPLPDVAPPEDREAAA